MKNMFSSLKKLNRKRRVLAGLTLAAVIAVAGVSVKQTMAYFTTYATAKGGIAIDIGPTTDVDEEFKDWKKTIQIENTGEVACYVRAKVIAASQFDISAEGSNWSLGDDGYYYYSQVVPVGGKTDSIVASITVGADVQTSFNVVVVQECTPAQYDENGNAYLPQDADWEMAAEYDVEEAAE